MTSKPKVVELDFDDLERKLDKIEQALGEETARPFRILLGTYLSLLQLLERGKLTIQRLRGILFGARTERTSNVLPRENSPAPSTGGQ